jgi:glutaminyl-tRNA synthetase
VIKNDQGTVVELRCTYDPATRGGNAPDGRKVKSTIHWVSAAHAAEADVRLYDRLFSEADPEAAGDGDFKACLNPASLTRLEGCKLEPALAQSAPGTIVQFERLGYFCADIKDTTPGRAVFNRTVTLRDPWAKIDKQLKAKGIIT